MFRIDELPKGFDALQKATPQAKVPTGWKCPVCQSINAPHKDHCGSCNPKVRIP
jgi:rubredoxin